MRRLALFLAAALLAGCLRPSAAEPAGALEAERWTTTQAPIVAARVQAACECWPSMLVVFADERALLLIDGSHFRGAFPYAGMTPIEELDRSLLAAVLDGVDAMWSPDRFATFRAAEEGWSRTFARPAPGAHDIVECFDGMVGYMVWRAGTRDEWATCVANEPDSRLLDAIHRTATGIARDRSRPDTRPYGAHGRSPPEGRSSKEPNDAPALGRRCLRRSGTSSRSSSSARSSTRASATGARRRTSRC